MKYVLIQSISYRDYESSEDSVVDISDSFDELQEKAIRYNERAREDDLLENEAREFYNHHYSDEIPPEIPEKFKDFMKTEEYEDDDGTKHRSLDFDYLRGRIYYTVQQVVKPWYGDEKYD